MAEISAPRPVVVVPVHRPTPSADEQFGLQRCGSLLANHPILLVHPLGLDLSAYRALLPQAQPKAVPPAWMASIRAYNRMLINPAFYSEFSAYTHLLIHEPDSLVLSDQLLNWCQAGHDFIGAPWFEAFDASTPAHQIVGVGNSGFCLLNIAAMLRVLTSKYRWLHRDKIVGDLMNKALGRPVPYNSQALFEGLSDAGCLSHAHQIMVQNFDFFLTCHFPSADPSFRIATVEAALQFAWEVNPQICLELNDGHLPFGIHAWARYDRNFVESVLSVTPTHD